MRLTLWIRASVILRVDTAFEKEIERMFEIKSAKAKIKSRVEAKTKVREIRNNSRKLKEERLSFNYVIERGGCAGVCVSLENWSKPRFWRKLFNCEIEVKYKIFFFFGVGELGGREGIITGWPVGVGKVCDTEKTASFGKTKQEYFSSSFLKCIMKNTQITQLYEQIIFSLFKLRDYEPVYSNICFLVKLLSALT